MCSGLICLGSQFVIAAFIYTYTDIILTNFYTYIASIKITYTIKFKLRHCN